MKTETELRELDAWIGVHVFGMKAISKDGPPPTKGVEEDYFVKEWIHISASLPHYTTDPAAAMLVLEKCIEKKGAPAFDKDKAGNFEIASIDKDCQAVFMVRAYTLPLAICLFAKELFK